jgi:hypothetical protein
VAQAWNAHVDTDPAAPLVGRFWEVPTWIFWSAYLRDPRPLALTPENFDRMPAGTTMFLASRASLLAAMRAAWPSGDARYASDDTAILRQLVTSTPTRIDPDFRAVYRPRLTFGAFLRHSHVRGVLFVDSYAGTTALRSSLLVLLVLLPPLVLAAVVVTFALSLTAIAWGLLGAVVVALLVPVAIAVAWRSPSRPLLAYVIYAIPFGLVFWAGLARGLVINRAAFRRRSAPDPETTE